MTSASDDDFSEFEFVDIERSEESEKDSKSAVKEPDIPSRTSFLISDTKKIVKQSDAKSGHSPTGLVTPSTLPTALPTNNASVLPSPRTPQTSREPKKEEENATISKENSAGAVKDKTLNISKTSKPQVSKVGPQGTQTLSGDLYCCKKCGTHISLESDVESRAFQVGHGNFTESKRGYLFTTAINLRLLVPCHENFTTGRYKISYVECLNCETQLGWKYLESENVVGKAKINKFCLRLSFLSRQA